MKNTFDLTILNQKFTLKSDEDEKHVKKVSDYVNKIMHEIVSSNKATATANVAILAALNIADNFFHLKKKNQETVIQWKERLKNILSQVEKL